MIRDLLDGPPAEPQHADVCIVGAGAAGILLAVELVRLGRTVLLLEGGGPDVEEPSQDPYRSTTSGNRHTGIHIGRFRASGGSTTRWGGQILELDSFDFEPRPGVQGSGWPIHKAELRPFYDRAIELEGLAQSTLSDDAVWREIGLDPPTFDQLRLTLSRWCPEPNFARLHRHTLADSPALTVWLHSNAVDLSWEGDRFRSVRCRTLSGVESTFSADRFVFCLGGIESSRFFLQPRPNTGPWLRSGLLGRFYQDHIITNGGAVEPLDLRRFHDLFHNIFSRGYKYQPKLQLDPAVQASQQTLNVAGSLNFLSSSDQDLNQIKTTAKHLLRGRFSQAGPADLLHALRHAPLLARQAWRYKVQHRAWSPADARMEFLVHSEQEPESRSRITLSSDRDAFGMLRTHLDWQVSEHELRSMRTLVEVAQRSLAPIARIVPDPALLALDPAFASRCGDNYHHMGGMRMSTSPSTGLVDPNLLLHGMSNGYVCSSAVFPTSGYSNPTHTLLALAVRLAAHLS